MTLLAALKRFMTARLLSRRVEFDWRAVPRGAYLTLALTVAGVAALRAAAPDAPSALARLRPPPSPALFNLASLGEPQTLARLLGLRLQAFDAQSGRYLAIASLPTAPLAAWLAQLAALDPRRHYPYFLAAYVYAHGDAERLHAMADFIRSGFDADPAGRWPYLAHIAVMLRKAGDLASARALAAALRQRAPADAPSWARQLEIFFAEQQGDFDAAIALTVAMLRDGAVRDEAEARFLAQEVLRRLKHARQKRAKP